LRIERSMARGGDHTSSRGDRDTGSGSPGGRSGRMDRRDWGQLFAEAIGTFLFFFVGCGSVVVINYAQLNNMANANAGLLGVAVAHGLVLAVLVSAFGAVSGGHFNPAVTFGVWIAGRIRPARAVLYVIAQLIGAVAAGFAVKA